MVNYRSRAAAALAFLLVLLLGSCDGLFNGRGGMPGYLQYVTDSVSLRSLGLPEPDVDSDVYLRFVRPDDFLAADTAVFPPGAPSDYLVLSYRSNPIGPERAMVFDRDLNLIFDTRDFDDDIGAYNEWVRWPRNWQIHERGWLDLGTDGAYLAGGGSPAPIWSERYHNDRLFLPVYDNGLWRDFLVGLDQAGWLRLSVAFQRNRLDNRNPATPGDYFGTPPNTLLINDPFTDIGVRLAAMDRIDLDLTPSGWWEIDLVDIIADRDNQRIMPVVSVRDGEQNWIQSFFIVFFIPYDDAQLDSFFTQGGAPISSFDPGMPYEWVILPSRVPLDREDTWIDFDGEYLRVFDGFDPDQNDYDEEAKKIRMDIYRISGSGWMPSIDSPRVEKVGSLPLLRLFPEMEFNYDYSFSFAEAEGRWYMYSREAHSLYELAIGVGGFQ